MRRPRKAIENETAEDFYAECFHAMRAAREEADRAKRERLVKTARLAWRQCLLALGMWLEVS